MSVWGQIPSKLMTTQLALVGPRVRAASSNPHSVSYLLWPLFGHFTYLSSVLSSGTKSRVETKMWRQRETHLPVLAWRHTADGKEASLQSGRGHTTTSRTANLADRGWKLSDFLLHPPSAKDNLAFAGPNSSPPYNVETDRVEESGSSVNGFQ